MKNENRKHYGLLIAILFLFGSYGYLNGSIQGYWCEVKLNWQNNDDLYCKDSYHSYRSNGFIGNYYPDDYHQYKEYPEGKIEVTNCIQQNFDVGEVTLYHSFKIYSKSQDEAKAKAQQERTDKCIQEKRDELKCYNDGYNITQTFDIQKDYDLNCEQLEYINDHLVDNVEQKDGGYIKGSSWGLFSGGYIEGQFKDYVITRISATGQLVQEINQHVNCREEKSEPVLDTYTEAEFVMYYVDKCIKGD